MEWRTSGEFLDSPSTTSATTYKLANTIDGNTIFIMVMDN